MEHAKLVEATQLNMKIQELNRNKDLTLDILKRIKKETMNENGPMDDEDEDFEPNTDFVIYVNMGVRYGDIILKYPTCQRVAEFILQELEDQIVEKEKEFDQL